MASPKIPQSLYRLGLGTYVQAGYVTHAAGVETLYRWTGDLVVWVPLPPMKRGRMYR